MNALSTSLRSSGRRRLRRRAQQDRSDGLFCRTNGCATFLEVEPGGAVARCPICGYSRRLPAGVFS